MAASGTMTGIVYYNKGVQLTVTYPRGGGGGAGHGIVLLAGGSPVLAAGGAATAGRTYGYGGGGYTGGGWCGSGLGGSIQASGYSWNGAQGRSRSSSGAGTGRYYSSSYNTWAWGGTGYCASGYSCSGGYADSTGYIYPIVTYCGPSSSSSCP